MKEAALSRRKEWLGFCLFLSFFFTFLLIIWHHKKTISTDKRNKNFALLRIVFKFFKIPCMMLQQNNKTYLNHNNIKNKQNITLNALGAKLAMVYTANAMPDKEKFDAIANPIHSNISPAKNINQIMKNNNYHKKNNNNNNNNNNTHHSSGMIYIHKCHHMEFYKRQVYLLVCVS
jgi:hypothetical protein